MIRYLTEMPDAGMLMSMALVPMPTLIIYVSVQCWELRNKDISSSTPVWWRTVCSYYVSRFDRHVTYYTSHMLYICIYSPWPALAEIHSSSLALNVFTSLHTCVLIVVTPDIEHSAVLLTWRQLIKARNKEVAEVQKTYRIPWTP